MQWDAQQLVRVRAASWRGKEGCYTWGCLWHLLELLTVLGQGLLSGFLVKNSLPVPHQKPAAVSTLLHAVGLRGQTGAIPNCKGVHVPHRESEVKISDRNLLGSFRSLILLMLHWG